MAKKGLYKWFKTKAEYDQHIQAYIHFSRLYALDDVCIALGRMGFTEDQFGQFNETYSAVADENALEVLADAKDDKKDLWYSKDCKERELKGYVGKHYVPREIRHK